MRTLLTVTLLSSIPMLLMAAPSREERQRLKYQALFMTGQDHRTMAEQLAVGKFLEPDSMLILKGGQGKFQERYQSVFGLQYRHFTGNSFYVAPELYYFNFTKRQDQRADDRVTALGASFRIGNQWQWKHFTVGADWIGIGRNLVSWNSTSKFVGSNVTYTLLNLQVGWSWW
jgi:hypothetical protein